MTATKARPLAKHPPPSGSILVPGVLCNVTIPMEPAPETSPNYSGHWAVKARARAALHEAAYFATREVVWLAYSEQPFPKDARLAVKIIIGWGKGRKRMDEDNAIACCKAAIDGFSKAIGVDDRHFTIAGVDQVRDSEGLGWVRIVGEVQE